MAVPVLKQGDYQIVSLQSSLSDAEWNQLMVDLVSRVGQFHSRGVVVDLTAVDMLDSYGTRVLRNMVTMTKLRGAQTVIVGVQPDVAFAMVQLGLMPRLTGICTALDLEDGLAHLDRVTKRPEPSDG